ncbi:hypothetical protein FACS1894202_07940 [Clostridia bacterium]|nr:hypothetical protein FACS1894202_07940 [Clostridia bacterium]
MNSYEATGKSLDEAIRAGLTAMNVERDAVSVEVLEKPKTGFFGLGSTLARVRLTRVEPEVLVTANVQPKPAPKPVAKAEPAKPVIEVKKAEAAPKPAPKPAPIPSRPAPKPIIQKPAPPRPIVPATEKKVIKPSRPTVPATAEQLATAREFITGLMERMGGGTTVSAELGADGIIKVTLEGENMGSLIGKRGDTLDAIQHLTSHIINSDPEQPCRVQVDAADYRAKRQEALEKLAQRMAENTLKYHNNMVLEPMNAYERHIIHTALQNTPGITTYSTGSEPVRRVVIACQRGGDKPAYRRAPAERNDKRGPRPPRKDFAPRPAAPVAPAASVTPVTPVASVPPIAPAAPAAPVSAAPARGLPVKEFGIKKKD